MEDSPENGEEEGDGDDGIPLPPGEAAVLKAEPKIYQQEEEKKRLVDETKLKVPTSWFTFTQFDNYMRLYIMDSGGENSIWFFYLYSTGKPIVE